MTACCVCNAEIGEDQESVRVPAEFGGGIAHQDCWDIALYLAKQVIRTMTGAES